MKERKIKTQVISLGQPGNSGLGSVNLTGFIFAKIVKTGDFFNYCNLPGNNFLYNFTSLILLYYC